MINFIDIKGYKCLNGVSLDFGNLNVLVGPNSSGKSSVLQALLLLRQSSNSEGFVDSLHLSGELYEAGTAEDVLHPAAEHQIRLKLQSDTLSSDFLFKHNRNTESRTQRRSLPASESKQLPTALSGQNDVFAYLNAERRGPRLTYPLPSEDAQLAGIVGKFGEFTPAVLARAANGVFVHGWNEGVENLLTSGPKFLDGKDVAQEIFNTHGRLDLVCNIIFNWIIPGASFQVAEHDQTDYASLRYGRPVLAATASTRATHSGFGLTYTLPIIAAALGIKPDGMMIVENPEAHLPPFSQSRIGTFLAMMSSTGRQIFVETHSDHVVNGIRLAVNKGLISHENVYIKFFNKKSSDDVSTVTPIRPLKNGRLDKWPEGFFDQIENDLSHL